MSEAIIALAAAYHICLSHSPLGIDKCAIKLSKCMNSTRVEYNKKDGTTHTFIESGADKPERCIKEMGWIK